MKSASHSSGPSELITVTLRVTGTVQGVGFRPFVYHLANGIGVSGWVRNDPMGVTIQATGNADQIAQFRRALRSQTPPAARVEDVRELESQIGGDEGPFEILISSHEQSKSAAISPDLALCADCLREVLDPADRRYRYPFINCTNCGPRFSIIEELPYDRANTTMKRFVMCPACRGEYDDPDNRRFHAQPNACPVCGPHLELWDSAGAVLSSHDESLHAAAEAIRAGKIVAVKGLGGFHLMVDARDESAVQELRGRKHREEKPFALMYPDLAGVQRDCEVSDLERELLQSVASPIVLLRRSAHCLLPTAYCAPGNPNLGVMLPYTPLHHLLMRELGFPVVATSGNLSDEPICIDEREALVRLAGIADVFLVHNRPIVRHVDDSIVRVIAGREMPLRRARGYAPAPVHVHKAMPPVLAVGPHLKNTVAISVGQSVFISQHIGDLETAQAHDAFTRVAADLQRLYELRPSVVACDEHPDYLSTQYARKSGLPVVPVQHHYAHVLSCMAENGIDPPVLGISWDGTGYGSDGTIWGGEFLLVNDAGFARFGHLRTFRLPGGDKAAREPRRCAMGLLYEAFGDVAFGMDLPSTAAFSKQELTLLQSVLEKKVNSPVTSSAGRLFDAVASLIGLRQIARFEGQAAMELEFALHGIETEDRYTFGCGTGGTPVVRTTGVPPVPHTVDARPVVLDWAPMVAEILADVKCQTPPGVISAKFHNTLVEAMILLAGRAGQQTVVLSGGCFQNRYLAERAIARLRTEGYNPVWHRRVPPNDNGISLGQIAAAGRQQRIEDGE